MDLLKEFNENGFVVLKNFLDHSKIKKLEHAIKSNIKFFMEKNNLKIKENFHDYGVIQLNKIRKQKKQFDSIQVIYNIIRKLPEFQQIISDEKLINIVKELSGINQVNKNGSPYIWEGFIRIDPPKDNTYELRWHQESYFTLPNSNAVQLWAPIINKIKHKENGTMTAIKNSSKLGEIPHHIIRQNENYISESIIEENIKNINLPKVSFSLKPGDIILFHQHLIHKTFANNGSKVRYTMVANYSNPYLRDFKFMNEEEVVIHHKKRTVNAEENKNYIKTFSKKGGIKDFKTIAN